MKPEMWDSWKDVVSRPITVLRAANGWRSLCWIVTNFNGRTYVLCKLRKGLTTALMYLTCLRIYVKTEYKSPLSHSLWLRSDQSNCSCRSCCTPTKLCAVGLVCSRHTTLSFPAALLPIHILLPWLHFTGTHTLFSAHLGYLHSSDMFAFTSE